VAMVLSFFVSRRLAISKVAISKVAISKVAISKTDVGAWAN
jgi:hypothetical protein